MKHKDNPCSIPGGLKGLQIFVQRHKDRSALPYYAGRAHVLASIEDACTVIWQSHMQGESQPHGLTRQIFGAPGAGKSSTLEYLRHVWSNNKYMTTEAHGTERPGPTPVMLYSGPGHILHSLDRLCKNLIKVVSPDSADELYAAFTQTMRKRAGVDIKIAKGEIEAEQTIQFVVEASLDTVAEILPPDRWTRPVVIGVDEAQNLPGDRHSPVGILLQSLHANDHNLPVLVVLAGLSDLRTRTSTLGLSRPSIETVHSLAGLNSDEMEDLKRGFCMHFDINLGQRESEFDALLARTDGWPAHIQNCLRSFGRIYLEAQGDINAVDFKKVEKLSLAARMEYCYGRMSKQMKDAPGLLGLLMTRLHGNMFSGHILSLIDQIDAQHSGTRDLIYRLPQNMTARDYFDELIHHGALQELDDGTVECPIPSFRQFMIEVGLREPTHTPPMRDVPREHGLAWDAVERIEAAHQIRQVH